MFNRSKDANRKISNGMERLTQNVPDWKEQLTPDLIEMKNGYPTKEQLSCVLCQLFGSYEAGLRALKLSYSQGPDFGFDVPPVMHWSSIVYGGSKLMFEALNAGWKLAVVSH